ncbi:QacE family quaternary ammonium compound efflux SMR transporter [Helicobacter aurati]|uniref:QacE family quaternary ammonium compound efflux SMR transporter n=1 Tax=Helicobacter aurati TaxID=137778 RepID=A0A3D8IY44_9HELI|nr:multidrug efflux SMR transporter [Helicobacter aurati]RDU69835.1 QacE family quaternary ammonium compound efflux SMR transporter [Helicobacter aurati]
MKKIAINTNMAWCLVIFGGIVECFWVSGLKHADNFALYALTGIGIIISFCCAILAMKKIEVGVCYAVFVGIGTAGVVLAEMFVFGEKFSLLKISFIILLLIGVIGLKFVSKANDNAPNTLAKDLGLDEIAKEAP